MKVLVACEYSGVVRDAFIAAGHDAMSCDLLPTDVPGPHYQGDVFDIINDGWDLMIAHPPCTYLANSGVRWLYEKWTDEEKALHFELTGRKLTGHSPRTLDSRWAELDEGADFFRALWEADIPRIAVENPRMHRHGIQRTGGRATQRIQPWWFGHPETKETGLRLKNLPPLVPDADAQNVYDYMMTLPKKQRHRIHYLSPGPDRWKERSRTFPGVARAMAEQWGNLPILSKEGAAEVAELENAVLS